MKRYQVIMPVALPIALVASVGFMIQQRMDVNTAYNGYLKAGQEYLQNGVLTSALESYEAALELRPTLEISLAIGNLYRDNNMLRQAEDWYEDNLLTTYPENVETYIFGIDIQLDQGNVREAYQIYDASQARGLQSDAFEEIMQPIRYSFDLIGDYEAVRPFSNIAGLAAVQQNGYWGFIDITGAKIIDNYYTQVGNFADMAPVVDTEGEAFFIDTAGTKRLTASYFLDKDPDFGQITAFGDIQSGLITAYNGSVWNYYDASTYEKKFGGYEYASSITNGVGAVSHDGKKWALVSADGQELTDFIFDEVVMDDKGVPCRTNVLLVSQAGQYMLVDHTTGQPINDNRYEDACAFDENSLAAVRKDGRWIFVDETGAESDLGSFEEAKSFAAGVAPAKQNGKWGYISTSGDWIIEPQFSDAKAFNSSGVAFVQDEKSVWRLLSLLRYHHD